MKKIDTVAAAFAELNHRIVTDILLRGYSHNDAETLTLVRENLKVLKDFEIDDAVDEKPARASKAGA